MSRRRDLLAGLLVVTLAAGACSVDGIAFVQDRRLEFTTPGDRESVTLPTTIEWAVEDVDVVDDGGAYGVFVDARPQPPGEPLSWFAEGDDDCQRREDCPDEEYYADRDIHTTTDEAFTIEFLPPAEDNNRREFHEVTVVLLDDEGRRIGESAWTVEFEVDRGQDA